MRGSPLIRALIAFLAILALGYPLRELTKSHAAAGNPVSTPARKAEVNVVRLQLTFTAVPQQVRVLHLGEEVWSTTPETNEIEQDLKLEFPPEGVDLQFEISWAGEALAAMRAVLTTPDGTQYEKSVWGQGSMTEVLTFP